MRRPRPRVGSSSAWFNGLLASVCRKASPRVPSSWLIGASSSGGALRESAATGAVVHLRTPGMWERYRGAILTSMGLIALEAVLIALLLVERERRRRAQLAIDEQMAYEQTMADLTTDAMRHSPEEEIPALEDALARISRYAGASRAVLVQYPDGPTRPPLTMTWSSDGVGIGADQLRAWQVKVARSSRFRSSPTASPSARSRSSGRTPRSEWPTRLVARLGAAGELIAGAMARARSARAVRAGEELEPGRPRVALHGDRDPRPRGRHHPRQPGMARSRPRGRRRGVARCVHR